MTCEHCDDGLIEREVETDCETVIAHSCCDCEAGEARQAEQDAEREHWGRIYGHRRAS